jgi:GTP cyclohydrolase II
MPTACWALPGDARDHAIGAEMLVAIGVQDVLLMTKNPAKVDDLMFTT